MRKKFLIGFVFGLLLIGLVSASFNLGDEDYYVQKEYPAGSYLISWLNISFNNHPLNSNFTDSVSPMNKIPLIEVFEMYGNSNYNYSCTTGNCGNNYGITSPSEIKTSTLKKSQYKLYAFNITDSNIQEINSLSLEVNSNADSSCTSQFKIDIGNDGSYEIANTLVDDDVCSGIYRPTCYYNFGNWNSATTTLTNTTKGTPGNVFSFVLGLFKHTGKSITGDAIYGGLQNVSQIQITTTPLCSEVNLPEAPGYKIGAWINHTNTASSTIKMGIYSLEGNKESECTLNLSSIQNAGNGEIYCNAPGFSLIENSKYYICIWQTSDQTAGKYNVKGKESLTNGCGFKGEPETLPTRDAVYDLSVKKLKYGKLSGQTLPISNDLPNSEKNLSDVIEKYILDNYGELSDCSSGCIVPFKLISYVDKGVSVSSSGGTSGSTTTGTGTGNVIAGMVTMEVTVCYEDDGGDKPYEPGTVTCVIGTEPYQFTEYHDDVCNNNVLTEYYLTGTDTYYYKTYTCAGGCSEYPGKCKSYCTDSDGLNNKFEKGTVTVVNGSGTTSKTDYCMTTPGWVWEYQCLGNNSITGNYLTCPTGYNCSDGACVSESNENSCSDSDEGQNFYVKGNVIGFYNGVSYNYSDYCSSGKIEEYYCRTIAGQETYDWNLTNCPTGYTCSSGRCISTGTTYGVPEITSANAVNVQSTSAILNAQTNIVATCKYSKVYPILPYSNMEGTFSTTNSKSHTTTLLGLTSNTDYKYYIKCINDSTSSNAKEVTFKTTSSGGSSSSCYDADANLGVQSVYTASYAIYNTKQYDDVCQGGKLIEQYCTNDILKNASLSCPYGCSNGACIKKTANTTIPDHTITLKNVQLKYNVLSGENVVLKTEKRIYNFEYLNYLINSNYQKLTLDGLFKLPNTPQVFNYNLKLNGTTVYTEQLKISNISMTVTPSIVEKGTSTTFITTISPEQEVKYLIWNFGDGSNITNQTIDDSIGTSSLDKTYSQNGNYVLTLTARIGSKDYTGAYPISVVDEIPFGEGDATCSELTDSLNAGLNDLRDKISEFNQEFDRESLTNVLKIDGIENIIDEFSIECLELEQNGATSDEIFELLITYWDENEDLFHNLEINEIIQTISEPETFNVKRTHIDLDKLSAITGEEFDEEFVSLYEDAIISWNQEDLISNVITRTYEFEFDDGTTEYGLNTFEFDFDKKTSVKNYYISNQITDLAFKEISFFDDNLNYTYSEISSNQNSLTLSTTDDIESYNLPAFISPSINKLYVLSGGDDVNNDEENNIIPSIKDNKQLFIILLIVGILVVLGIIALVIFLKKKKGKEIRLFKNKTNLYNIMQYINNSKRKGMTNEQISESLTRAGWSSEQTKYALKKFSQKSK
ncbi:MAG: hypothetical protein WC812_03070 [Candidatus Pacearchaeota archaeon]|jgi:hypothetical protein